MKQQKKGKFLTFMFSFIPGAAEMYMGFMKQGISLMALFVVNIIGLAYGLEELFVPAMILTWFYCFFHARNLAVLPEEAFNALEDAFIGENLVQMFCVQYMLPSVDVINNGV